MFSLMFRAIYKLQDLLMRFELRYANPGRIKYLIANAPQISQRRAAMRALGVQLGQDVSVNPGVRVNMDNPKQAKLIIGDRVSIAVGVSFICNSGPNSRSHLHHIPYIEQNLMHHEKPITVGDDSWIGAGAIILPTVKIGKGVIIGANSLVRKDCPDYTVWAGVPARQVRNLRETEGFVEPK